LGDSGTVLVTGSSGFLGRVIVNAIIEQTDYDVIGIDTKLNTDININGNLVSNFFQDTTDITNWDQLKELKYDYDAIIHLAAIAAPRLCDQNPQLAFNTNVIGTLNILKLAKLCGITRRVKVVFASSAHVYNISPKFMPTPENHPIYPMDTYTTTKVTGEYYCRLFWEDYGIPYTTIRLFNSYGPNQSTDYFIPAQIEKAKKGDFIMNGAGITKDFVYVEDVADAYVSAMLSEYVGEINIGSGVQTELGSVAQKIADYFGVKVTLAPTNDNSPTAMQAQTERAKTILGWQPTTNFEEGLERTIKSY
jgi:UDP-glucose 4-epimerase